MISNMQHQQFESVAMEQILPQSTTASAVVVEHFVNNNNNSKLNKNIHLMASSDILPYQDSDVIIFDANDIFGINPINSSSSNTKEITVTALPTITASNIAPITTNPVAARNHQSSPSSTNNYCQSISATVTGNLARSTTINNVAGEGNLIIQQMPVVVNSSEAVIDSMMKQVINDGLHNHEYALSRTELCDAKPVERRSNHAALELGDKVCKKMKEEDETESQKLERERQQRQSDALRCIEDVHNYSKSPKSQMDESTNSSSEEEDEDDDIDVDDDDDEDMDDDVFDRVSPKSTTTSAARTISKGPVANKINVCDKSANQSTPKAKKVSQQHQMQTNQQFSRNTKTSTSSSSDEMNCVSPAATTTKSSPKTSTPLKLDLSTISSTSPHRNSTLKLSPTFMEKPSVSDRIATATDDADSGENCDGINGSGGAGGVNGGDKLAPDHHARRPMNAFLIFCKRHRAIVRDKYKNLENRQITKILGEWWATLSNVEKAGYTDLAKQYKDAFFKANPNFKWYKLPAPPLRTGTIRPEHSLSPTSPLLPFSAIYLNDFNNAATDDRDGASAAANNRYNCDNGYVRKSSFSFNYADDSSVRNSSNNSGSPSALQNSASNAVGVFKLADEAQMGSLSMLCGSSSSSNSPNSELIDKSVAINDNNKQDALQNALGDASNFLSATIKSRDADSDPYQNMRDHAHRMEANHVSSSAKRKSSDESVNNGWSPNKKPYSPTEGSERAARSCKGKRYQELMISGQIASFGKKSSSKARMNALNNSPLNGFVKPTADHNRSFDSHHPLTLNLTNFMQSPIAERVKPEIIIPDHHVPRENSPPCANQSSHMEQPDSPNSQKQFDASDFDLEEKIKALPAQCLESYLTRKRETKKKRKIGSKRRPATSSASTTKAKHHYQSNHHYQSPPKTIQEARERIQNSAVGSQKRKARKESITRRDVNGMNSAANHLLEAVGLMQFCSNDATVKIEYDPENMENSSQLIDGIMTVIKEEKEEMPNGCNGSMDSNSTPTSDLLILAEVATFAKSHY